MVSKINNFVISFLDRAHLDTKKILTTYIYALILIPLFFGSFIVLTSSVAKQNINVVLNNTPLIAIDMIVALTDFIMGYYIWLKKDLILKHEGNYRFLMFTQAISQLMVGNIFCLILALFGIIRIYEQSGKLKCQSNFIKVPAVIFLTIFGFCLVLTISIFIRK
ncbi:hypothetical protein [uncultured Lactobacillus sp.]|uniref:hypothetical protein n=1 Tax=uncultured Lactobacillus sp. TaxID=153152 RepID=UPI0025EFDED0|nr:hypothetical protein [uncultured Lactobacillus sp.]